jgi:heparin/heparan-sulfate lyase
MGDGGGRRVNNERDKAAATRRILVNRYRDDPAHQVVHTYNEQTPAMAFDHNSYRDFLWTDRTVKKGDLKSFKLSHYSPGPGFVHARSSWEEDATYLFFKCGRRFTAHQHLDQNHFVLWKNQELLGDGGQYDSFESDHCNNIYCRTIAHNTILVKDPSETFPQKSEKTPKGMRNGPPAVNDGGQKYPWSGTPWGHNGGAFDVESWMANRELGEIAHMIDFQEKGDNVYMAGDATKAYDAKKLSLFTRQIVYIRPHTVVIFDRVRATDASFRKTFLLQAMKPPVQQGEQLVITNGTGRVFVQTLLPTKVDIKLNQGDQLYTYDGVDHPPSRDTGPAPECRIEISPAAPAETDYFLHVLTTSEASVDSVPKATVKQDAGSVSVTVGGRTLTFGTETLRFSM